MEGKNLQKAVRQIGMSEEMKGRVIKNVLAKGGRRPVRVVRPLRAALIAACVCLLLAGTAFAAVRSGFGPEWFFSRQEDGITVVTTYTELKAFAVDEFSPEVQAELAKTGQHDDRSDLLLTDKGEVSWSFDFDSWQEVEDYLGLSLPDNPLLERSRIYTGNARPHPFSVKFEDMGYIEVRANYEIDGVLVQLTMELYTELYHHASNVLSDFTMEDGRIQFVNDSRAWNVSEEELSDLYSYYELPDGTRALLQRVTDGAGTNSEGGFTRRSAIHGGLVRNGIYIDVLTRDAEALSALFDENGVVIGYDVTNRDGSVSRVGSVPYDPDMSLDYDGVLYRVLDGFAMKK